MVIGAIENYHNQVQMVLHLKASVPYDAIFFAGELFTCQITFQNLSQDQNQVDDEEIVEQSSNKPENPVILNELKQNEPVSPKAATVPQKISTFSVFKSYAGTILSAVSASPPKNSPSPVPATPFENTADRAASIDSKEKQPVSNNKVLDGSYSAFTTYAGNILGSVSAPTPIVGNPREGAQTKLNPKSPQPAPSHLKINGNPHAFFQSPSVSCEFPQYEILSSTEQLVISKMAGGEIITNQRRDVLDSELKVEGHVPTTKSMDDLADEVAFNMKRVKSADDIKNMEVRQSSFNSSNEIGGKIEVTNSLQKLAPRSREQIDPPLMRDSNESLDAIKPDTDVLPHKKKPPLAPIKITTSSGNENIAWVFAQMVGKLSVDSNYVKESLLEPLDHQLMYQTPGLNNKATGGGGGTLGVPSTDIPKIDYNAMERTYPIYSTPPTILFCDECLKPGEKKTCNYRLNDRYLSDNVTSKFTPKSSWKGVSNCL
jgi:hypothetical protein